MVKEEIKKLVINTLIEITSYMPELNGTVIDENSPLLAEGSFIDSLTLVSFIVDLETTLIDEYDLNLSLTDDRAMTREISPYESVQFLVDYIDELVNNN
jgi:acyl carrier protein